MEAPSIQAQERGARARKELEARGFDVRMETKWWGFHVHLMNRETADNVAEITEFIADIVEAVIPKIGKLVAGVMQIHAAWVKAVNGPHGVKCTSPWIATSMLIPTRREQEQDTSLWWSVFEPAKGWGTDEKFAAHYSGSNPALAEFNGRLYLAHRGHNDYGDDPLLWYSVYTPATGWSEDIKFPGHASSHGPALATFGGKLYCVHRGSGSDHRLWWTRFDGSTWNQDTVFPGHASSHGPALAEFGGKLHCVHKAGVGAESMWHTTFNGSTWSADRQIRNFATASNPALAVYKGRLHCVHRASGSSTQLFHFSSADGVNWSEATPIPGAFSLEGPSLAVYDDKLYCVHRGHGSGDQNLWWTVYNGSTWSKDTMFPGHASAAGPAAIAYRDANADRGQLLVVHRGYGKRVAGTDAAEVEAQIAAEQAAGEHPGTA
ncbi:hypothetical protein OG413_02240 [Streptomyces sp. NBC_01433]|uniref:hypothetical protein n=1 Tax=Streptomyces sp. NBC_01433 TaxID=2903864 RepID=UPI00225BA63A|nr:hypothetical protein [Streptomyces sp. NBC_01433]MCX4674146.1 hypothetical protein [Streptomyces sp. NBC_01433]